MIQLVIYDWACDLCLKSEPKVLSPFTSQQLNCAIYCPEIRAIDGLAKRRDTVKLLSLHVSVFVVVAASESGENN